MASRRKKGMQMQLFAQQHVSLEGKEPLGPLQTNLHSHSNKLMQKIVEKQKWANCTKTSKTSMSATQATTPINRPNV